MRRSFRYPISRSQTWFPAAPLRELRIPQLRLSVFAVPIPAGLSGCRQHPARRVAHGRGGAGRCGAVRRLSAGDAPGSDEAAEHGVRGAGLSQEHLSSPIHYCGQCRRADRGRGCIIDEGEECPGAGKAGSGPPPQHGAAGKALCCAAEPQSSAQPGAGRAATTAQRNGRDRTAPHRPRPGQGRRRRRKQDEDGSRTPRPCPCSSANPVQPPPPPRSAGDDVLFKPLSVSRRRFVA